MTAFLDLDDYLALPRVLGLAVSPDGSRVVTTITELNDKRTEFITGVGSRPDRAASRSPVDAWRQGGVVPGLHR
jgi:hypothetical protein